MTKILANKKNNTILQKYIIPKNKGDYENRIEVEIDYSIEEFKAERKNGDFTIDFGDWEEIQVGSMFSILRNYLINDEYRNL